MAACETVLVSVTMAAAIERNEETFIVVWVKDFAPPARESNDTHACLHVPMNAGTSITLQDRHFAPYLVQIRLMSKFVNMRNNILVNR